MSDLLSLWISSFAAEEVGSVTWIWIHMLVTGSYYRWSLCLSLHRLFLLYVSCWPIEQSLTFPPYNSGLPLRWCHKITILLNIKKLQASSSLYSSCQKYIRRSADLPFLLSKVAFPTVEPKATEAEQVHKHHHTFVVSRYWSASSCKQNWSGCLCINNPNNSSKKTALPFEYSSVNLTTKLQAPSVFLKCHFFSWHIAGTLMTWRWPWRFSRPTETQCYRPHITHSEIESQYCMKLSMIMT
jgi:hypothetical protein